MFEIHLHEAFPKNKKIDYQIVRKSIRLMFDLAFYRQLYYIEFGRYLMLRKFRDFAMKQRKYSAETIIELDFHQAVNQNETEPFQILLHYINIKNLYFSM